MQPPPRLDPDLTRALSDPGFTPGRRHLPALLDLLAVRGEHGTLAERALRRAGVAALPAVVERAARAEPKLRAALTSLVGRLAAAAIEQEAAELARAFLVARLADDDPRTRRMAAVALGKPSPASDHPDARDALARAARGEPSPDVRRALITALGKAGGSAALEVIAQVGDDAAIAPVRARAELLAKRGAARSDASAIAGDLAPERPLRVAVRCRRGLEPVLADELAAIAKGPGSPLAAPEIVRDPCGGTRVEATLRGPLRVLFQARTMLSFAFLLPSREQRRESDRRDSAEAGGALADAVAAQLLSPEAGDILRRFTEGVIRYRIAWAGGGKRRAAVFGAAAKVHERAPDLVNDPTQSTWDVIVYEGAGRLRAELAPRLKDPRFTYRRGDVPAASHPTIAAALARLAGARADDVVWDPFVGSGLELCERALLGPYRRLIGSDLDGRALEVARQNLDASGAASAELHTSDACGPPPAPEAPTLILTNPPLGRRVLRGAGLAALLERFVERAAVALAPSGRLVWISPFPDDTAAVARRSGLRAGTHLTVDLGGFDAQIQVFSKPPAERATVDRSDHTYPRGRGRTTPRRDAEEPHARREEHRADRKEHRHDHRDDHAAPTRPARRPVDVEVSPRPARVERRERRRR